MATATEKDAPTEVEAELDAIVPRGEARRWTIGDDDTAKVYLQRPLSFFAKTEWLALVARAVDEMLQSDGGGNVAYVLAQLFRPKEEGDPAAFDISQVHDAAAFAAAASKLGDATPEFLKDSFCIWLNVPRHERELVKENMGRLPDEGGLSDDDGMEIIEVFLDQNAEALKGFFTKRMPMIVRRAADRLGMSSPPTETPPASEATASLKPSRGTRARTPKA